MAFVNLSDPTRPSMAEINITPLVDVVLVLLIIFMVTAPILQTGIEVNRAIIGEKSPQEAMDDANAQAQKMLTRGGLL